MISLYVSSGVKVGAVPLIHLLNQPALLVDNKIHSTTEGKGLARGLLVRQVLEESAAVDGADAAPASAIGQGFLAVRALNLHGEIGDRGTPDVEVAS